MDKGGEGEHIRLDANFEVDTGGGSLGIVDSLGTGLNIGAHTVIVASSERRSVTQAVDSDGIVRSAEADGTGIAGETTLGDVVSGLSTKEEPVAAKDGVGSECWSLNTEKLEDGTFARKIKCRTLKMSREARVCRPGCL